jgi:hypothetical protein
MHDGAHKALGMSKKQASLCRVSDKPSDLVVAVELAPPSPDQRKAAEGRIADLIANLWTRGLLAADDLSDDK